MNKHFFPLLLCSMQAAAVVPVSDLTFETVTQTAIPFENDIPVRLADTKGCLFYGSTKETDLSGVINEMLKRKAYHLEITQVVCDQQIKKVRPVLVGITRPIEPGEKIRLPFIDVAVMTAFSDLQNKVDDMQPVKSQNQSANQDEFASKLKDYSITPIVLLILAVGFIGWISTRSGDKNGKYASMYKSHLGTIEFNDGKAITVNGLLISEFGYLLRYYSNGKLDNFDNLQAIAELSDSLIAAIDTELMADETKEQRNLGVSRNTAIANLGNLRSIILTLTAYLERKK